MHMRHFFMKKYVFAVIFLFSLGVFSAWNIYSFRDDLSDLGKQFCNIRSIDDLKSWIAEVNTETVDNIAGKMKFIEIYGYANELAGKKEMQDFRYVKDRDGITNYGNVYPVLGDTWEYAVRIRKIKEYAEKNGLKVLFVSPPSKILEGVSHLEKDSLVSDPNPVQDQFLWQLQQNRVPALDLREPLKKSGLSSTDLFFKSDHHWTPEAAFIATGSLVDEIRRRYGDDLDPDGFYCNLENYNKITYPQSECGSIARNAGIVYTGADDFTFIWPKFETSFYWKAYSPSGGSEVYEGNITESLLRLNLLTNEDVYRADAYRVYANSINTVDEITNLNNPDGPGILALRDSYFGPMACFLAPMCSRIDMAWMNTKENWIDFDDYLEEKIESGKYDYLLIELYPYSLTVEDCFPDISYPDKEGSPNE